MGRPPKEAPRHRVRFSDLLQQMESAIIQARINDRDADPALRVYFVQESGIGAVKIGISKRPHARIRDLELQTPHKLTLLATVEGGACVESALHLLFANYRIRGEWFHPVPELLSYIKTEGEAPEVQAARERELKPRNGDNSIRLFGLQLMVSDPNALAEVESVMEIAKGSVRAAAKLLGVHEGSLSRWLRLPQLAKASALRQGRAAVGQRTRKMRGRQP